MDRSDPCETCHRSKGTTYLCDAKDCGAVCISPNGGPLATLTLNSLDSTTVTHLCLGCFNKVVAAISARMSVTYLANEN